MNLQELQKTWKIGRIEINLTSRDDKTDGNVVIPLSTDMSTAALIAAAVESVEKVGPCLAHFKLNKIDEFPVNSDEYHLTVNNWSNWASFSTIDEYIEHAKISGVTHLIFYERMSNPKLFNDVFYEREKYSFLIKEFNSNDYGYNYLIKIYRIDFEEFDRLKIQN